MRKNKSNWEADIVRNKKILSIFLAPTEFNFKTKFFTILSIVTYVTFYNYSS